MIIAWVGTALAAYETFARSNQSGADAAAGGGGGPSQSNTRLDQEGSTYNFGGIGNDQSEGDATMMYVIAGVAVLIGVGGVLAAWRN